MKYYGTVGYAETTETAPGVWEETIVERPYCGDIIQLNRRLETKDTVNDGINITNKISIVSDPYAIQNFMSIRYVTWLGNKWKVSDVQVQPPRLIFSIGGLYNDGN